MSQRKRLALITLGLVVFALILVSRLFYLQILLHNKYAKQASNEHTSKYSIPAARGELYVHDGDTDISPIALNQTLNILYADPRFVTDKAATAQKLAAITGGSASDYEKRLDNGIEYAVIADRVPNDVAAKIKALNLPGVGLTARDYRTYPEGSLAAQTLGFVNDDGQGQYGIEQYLNDSLDGTPGQLSGKTDTFGLPIYTADNIDKPAVNGKSYLLTIDRNVQAEVEKDIAAQVQLTHAKSGSAVVLDPNTGAVIAMANYPTFDPNNYDKVTDYSVFSNQVVAGQYETGSGMKVFTMAAGLDQGKVTPDTTYNDPLCYQIDDRIICDAAGTRQAMASR